MLDTIGSHFEQTASIAHRTCAFGKFIGFGLTLEALWCYGEKAPELSVASYLCTGLNIIFAVTALHGQPAGCS